MKNKRVFVLLFCFFTVGILGLLISCDEEKATNSNPIACLQITSFQPSVTLKSVNAGQSYTFFREVKNDGPSNADEVTLGYYLSTDEKISSEDTSLNIEDKFDLTSGASNSKNVDIKIPSSVAPGTKYYIGVLVASSSCTNNCTNYKSYQLTITDTPSANSSCLFINKWQKLHNPENFAVSGDEDVLFVGEIRNDGPIACDKLTINFYLSKDSTITTQDTLLDTLEDGREIPVGTTENITQNIHIPNNLETGEKYYIGMMIVLSSCENTCSPTSAYEVLYEPYPYSISIWTKLNANIPVFRGDTVTYRREIRNTGTVSCTNVRIGYFLSTDSNITVDDTNLGEEIINLPFNGINTAAVNLQIPFTLSGNCHYLGILILSSSCSSVAAPSRSDLFCVGDSPIHGTINYGPGSVQPTDVTCGNAYTFYRIIKNSSTRDCDVTLRYYLSTDCSFTGDDTYLGVQETFTISALSENTGPIDLAIPAGLSPDIYHISALITSTNCSNPQPPIGWDIAVTCPSTSDPIGTVRPDQKLKATCH